MSTSQQSTTQRRASPSSQYPDSPYTQQTTATDVCSACGSRPLPAPLAQGTSCVDVDQDQSNVIVNQPLTVSDPMGIDHNSPLPAQTPSELPSQVEETLAVCPRFRIVVVGNSGVGKSSLISSVFNIRLPDNKGGPGIDIAHDRVGRADIGHEHYSDENPRFILHDSMGFEPGSTEKSSIVTSFLQDRAEGKAKLPDQVHAIWLCIETPRTGSRLLQTGDDDLLDLAKQLKIPVIVVFTKYDILFNEHYRDCRHIKSPDDRRAEAAKRAERAFIDFTKHLTGKFPFVPVLVSAHKDSTRKATQKQKEYEGEMLVRLTKVTRDNLRDVEGSLWALWATAQQINARQKVDISIREGLKKYWRDLGESFFFEGYLLVNCIARIRDDILEIWNFYDPEKVLSGEEFRIGMIELVEPLAAVSRSDEIIRNQRVDNMAGLANVATVATAVSSGLALPVLGTTMAFHSVQFLHSKYQRGVFTAIYLAAYIVDLILVLHEIWKVTVATLDPPKSLTSEIVMDGLSTYKSGSSRHIHAQLKEVSFPFKLEEKIASLIREAL